MQITTIIIPTDIQFFTDEIPFWLSNQQCENTEVTMHQDNAVNFAVK